MYAMKDFYPGRFKIDSIEEFFIHKKLGHPNVIEFCNMFRLGRRCFLVMKLASRGDLARLIRSKQQLKIRKYFATTEIENKLFQIAKGMHYLHKQNIIHRDVKPGNLLVDVGDNGEDVIKITDFGLSKDGDKSSVVMSSICGTDTYMAPEVMDLEVPHYTKECDIWSAGCVLFELWCTSKIRTFNFFFPILSACCYVGVKGILFFNCRCVLCLFEHAEKSFQICL